MDTRHNANNRTLSCRKLIDSIYNILQWKYINSNQDRIKNKERQVFDPFPCILGLSRIRIDLVILFSNDAKGGCDYQLAWKVRPSNLSSWKTRLTYILFSNDAKGGRDYQVAWKVRPSSLSIWKTRLTYILFSNDTTKNYNYWDTWEVESISHKKYLK